MPIHVAPTIDYLQKAYDDARVAGASEEPLIECFLQTPTDASLAPPGKHIFNIWAQWHPYHLADGVAWDDIREREAEKLLRQLMRGSGKPELSGLTGFRSAS